MPIHDWTKVDAGIFHDFHNVWIGQLRNALNEGLLPEGYYALSEQHAGKYITDVLTLHSGRKSEAAVPMPVPGGVAVAEAPPRVRRKVSLTPAARTRRKTLTIRHVSNHRIVALLEIVSPANKDRKDHVDEFVNKLEDALQQDIHVLLVDLLPPGRYDPQGMHGALWERLGDEFEGPPGNEPLTLASYVAESPIDAYLEHVAVGSRLPDMPLFLTTEYYISVPLEKTYQTTWQGTPAHWRGVLEGGGQTTGRIKE